MKRNYMKKYLLLAFLPAWVLQIAASVLALKGSTGLFSPILSVSMFVPLLAAICCGADWKGIGWKPRLKGNVKMLLAAWFLPSLLGTLGAVLYFALVPKAFSSDYAYIRAMLGDAGIAQLEAQGLSLPLYTLVSAAASLTWAPWINMLFAVGEEAGWRGVMYPHLKSRCGTVKGLIIGGIIWGIWHWPVMVLAGYEYGTVYWGAPVTGPLLFCLICVAMGILLDWVYEKTRCIWVPALAHGAINAFAGVPSLWLAAEYSNNLLVGPLMIGILGGLPLILFAFFLLHRAKQGRQ